MPVVFKLNDSATEAVAANAPVSLQASVGSASVAFETESDVRLIPGALDAVVAVAPELDAYYLPPPGLSDLGPIDQPPTDWRLKSAAIGGSETLQLDPAVGLAKDLLLDIAGEQYRIAASPNGDLVEIDPPLIGEGLAAGTRISKVNVFTPFEGARNVQSHVLYLGHADALNVEAEAIIEVVGGQGLGADATWEYFGKVKANAAAAVADSEPRWQPMQAVPTTARNAIALKKPQGSMETLEIHANTARWIRARKGSVVGSGPVQSIDSIALRINPSATAFGSLDPKPLPAQLLSFDVVVNTTPADAQNPFYPLGRTPRMFDTLYIGCAEAFSKAAARAQIRFDLADPTFVAMSALQTIASGNIAAGVDKSGALQLFTIKPTGELEALRGMVPQRPPGSATRLTQSAIRPAMWSDATTTYVAVLAGNDVWLWREVAGDAAKSGWDPQRLGAPPFDNDPTAIVTSLIAVVDSAAVPLGTVLLALRDGKVSWCDLRKGVWNVLDPQRGGAHTDVAAFAPMLTEATKAPTPHLLAILADGHLAEGKLDSSKQTLGLGVDIGADVDPSVQPLGMVRPSVPDRIAVAVTKAPNEQLIAWSSHLNSKPKVRLEKAFTPFVPTSIDGRIENGQLVAYLPVKGGGTRDLITWSPFDPNLKRVVFQLHGDTSSSPPNGAPVLFGDRAYVPGTARGEINAAQLRAPGIPSAVGALSFDSAVALPPAQANLAHNDIVAVDTPTGRESRRVVSAQGVPGRAPYEQMSFWPLDHAIARGTALVDVTIYKTSGAASFTQGKATVQHALSSDFTLDPNDNVTKGGDAIVVDNGGVLTYVHYSDNGPGNPTVAPAIAVADPVRYWVASQPPVNGRIFPTQDLPVNVYEPDRIRYGDIYFTDAAPTNGRPRHQPIVAVANDGATPPHATWIALGKAWIKAPVAASNFLVDERIASWTLLLSDTSSNPLLAWEYWNGSGWWHLDGVVDTTNNLRNSGDVQFDVPVDSQAADWAGKNTYWVRARLVGGDYGQEKVVVTTTPLPAPAVGTEQVVTRSTEGIQPPYALDLWIRYKVDTAVVPTYFLTQDSGTPRDQSDANRVPGTMVEMFTPLGTTLQRIEARSVSLPAAATGCPSECGCNGAATSAAPAGVATSSAPSPATSAAATPPARALFLGFTKPPSGAPVNVLLLVDQERQLDAFAPLRVEALAGDRFVPVIAADATRGLGESGVLSMSLTVAPAPAELFGRTLSWLRLTPLRAPAKGTWNPGLRAAYVNAVWASARETLTRELVGSSEGAPGLTLTLARPPVLHDTLELRVREPLGDEEIAKLRNDNPDRVLTDVENLAGAWVLWTRVTDPLDEDAGARVYSLDEATGTIRFGDGQHGMIPPIDRDCIVAFKYQRTEPPPPGTTDVPGNAVRVRVALNLVSPVETVESVIAADDAAGGSPPETDERVLRFASARLRHRDRAVTADDFEDIALESSVDIAQVRCFMRPNSVRVVVVMRGTDPRPSAAQARELRAALLEAASPALAAPDAVRIVAPTLRRVRIDLGLSVESLDHAGSVGNAVKSKLESLFNPATGALDQSGWPLGVMPRDDDVAVALQDIPNLAGIGTVAFREIASDGTDRALSALGPSDLIVPADESVRLDFDVVETAA